MKTGIVGFQFSSFSISYLTQFCFADMFQLKSFVLPESVKSISEYVFRDCISIIEISLNEKVENISYYAFFNCSQLKRIIIDSNTALQSLDQHCFDKCSSLIEFKLGEGKTLFHFANGILFDCEQSSIFMYLKATKQTKITIPQTVKVIKPYSFSDSPSIKKVYFKGDGLETIGTYAFSNCINLNSINFPSTLITIESNAFQSCGFESVSLSRTQITTLNNKVLSNNRKLSQIILPNSLSSISSDSFESINHRTNVFYFGINIPFSPIDSIFLRVKDVIFVTLWHVFLQQQ